MKKTMEKYINKTIIIFVSVLLLTSCSDWLTLEPENDLIKKEYWKTKGDVQATLVGAYTALSENVSYLLLWGELRGDMLDITLKTPLDQQRMMTNIITNNSSLVSWSGIYKIINYTNNVLINAPKVKEIDPSFSTQEYNQMIAEAFFLRSLSYFYLVRVFRDVPFVEVPSESDRQDYKVAKSDEMTVLGHLIADLESVKEDAPVGYTTVAYTKGRATKGAINALLADIYLYRGSIKKGNNQDGNSDFQASITACKAVRSLPYSLLPQTGWFTLFYPGNSAESIFELQFNKDLGQTNSNLARFSFELNFELAASAYIETFYSGNVGDIRALGGTYFPTAQVYNEVWKYTGTAITASSTSNRRAKDRNDNNFIIYRLADVYLLEAEARLLVNATDEEARQLIQTVKNRASTTPAQWNLDLSELLVERSRELAYEGKRWFDLLRYARRSEDGKQMVIDILLSSVSASDRPFFESKYKDINSYYLPIHVDELNLNPNLIQNPFYQF
jgi:starch-binding outer membrane protein, SusD/RagB family